MRRSCSQPECAVIMTGTSRPRRCMLMCGSARELAWRPRHVVRLEGTGRVRYLLAASIASAAQATRIPPSTPTVVHV